MVAAPEAVVNALQQLPVWGQALIAAAPWCVLVLLIGAFALCLFWPDDEDVS